MFECIYGINVPQAQAGIENTVLEGNQPRTDYIVCRYITGIYLVDPGKTLDKKCGRWDRSQDL